MKKILQTTMIGFLAIAVSCNSSSTTADDSAKADSVKADTSSPAGDNSTASPSNATTQAKLTLAPDQEVPATKSSGSGTADVTYNKDTKMLTYTLNYSGLTGKATMAHIHGTAPKGTNAGVKHDLTGALKKETSGNFTDSVKIDASGIKEDSLLSGFYYFNIHTPANPGGEIRAQIEFK